MKMGDPRSILSTLATPCWHLQARYVSPVEAKSTWKREDTEIVCSKWGSHRTFGLSAGASQTEGMGARGQPSIRCYGILTTRTDVGLHTPRLKGHAKFILLPKYRYIIPGTAFL